MTHNVIGAADNCVAYSSTIADLTIYEKTE